MGGAPPIPQRSPRRGVLKALLWALCLLILLASIAAFLLYRAAGAVPMWYRPPDPAASSTPAREAENTLIEIQTWAGAHYAWNYAHSRGRQPLAKEPDQRLTITLTQTQINALLQKWFLIYSEQPIGRKPLKHALRDPMVHLTPDRISAAATLLDMNSRIMSIDFRPEVLPDGQLNLQLLAIRAGTLPLPEFAWPISRARMLSDLTQSLPQWRARATVDTGGGANVSCIAAISAAQAIATLERRPAPNALLIPIVSEHIALPARIASMETQGDAITMTLEAMRPEACQQLLAGLRDAPTH